MAYTLLIVEDEKHTREGLQRALEEAYDVYVAKDAAEAIARMDQLHFDVILTDLRMGAGSGMTVIDKALSLPQKPACIMMTAYANVDTAVQAMKRGAYDFLPKPVNLEKLELTIERALQQRRLKEDNAQLRRELAQAQGFDGVIGGAPAFKALLGQVAHIAPTKATVLLQGETGTGKEVIARLLHERSDRAQGPFIAVHCAALPANLLESELFGYEKGAFTGATQRRVGRFEAASSGTLFLDEIGEIDAAVQVKLLRFLETRSIERLGSHSAVALDVRLIAATHRDLAKEVKEGRFREDLYYRLSVVPLHLPALRERPEDILVLVHHYLEHFSKENGRPCPKLSARALEALLAYEWPGNIRELRNLCENCVVMHSGSEITLEDLPKRLSELLLSKRKAAAAEKSASKKEETVDAKRLAEALRQADGNKTKAAELLGISRRTLHRWMGEK